MATGAMVGFAGGAIATGSLSGAIIGGVTAGFAFGIGDAGAYMGRLYGAGANLGTRVALHGGLNSFMSKAQGGRWSSGFWSGAVGTSLASLAKTGNYYGNVASNAIIGGTISRVTGGKFANGAAMGAFRYMFNEALHNKWDRDAYLQKQANLRAKMQRLDSKSSNFKIGLSNLSPEDRVVWEERIRIGKLQSQSMQTHNLNCTCGPTSNQMGLVLSVGALVTPGGWGYAMGASAVALDLYEPDYTGAFIGATAMMRMPYMGAVDIIYGIAQVVGE